MPFKVNLPSTAIAESPTKKKVNRITLFQRSKEKCLSQWLRKPSATNEDISDDLSAHTVEDEGLQKARLQSAAHQSYTPLEDNAIVSIRSFQK